MPKITLNNSETGEDEDFEPVDAREILARKDTIYTISDAVKEQMGAAFDLTQGGQLNIPQLQGVDAEMQTGNSVDKYARSAVVKAIPGDATADRAAAIATADNPQTTTGKPLAKSAAAAHKEANKEAHASGKKAHDS